MSLTTAAWFVILCALVMANLPFLLERRLAPWPWSWRAQEGGLPAWLRWILGLAFLAGVALWSWGTRDLVGGSFAGGASVLFLVKLLLSLLIVGGLLALPGWKQGDRTARTGMDTPKAPAVASAPAKSFFDRLLEVLVGYVLVGTLGFALELNLGNAFPQGWEFYAVTLALFLVLGYPGFVWRYMMRRRTR